ncbi:MAG: hypothetical protein ACRDN9_14330 [Streptosporangiaceae bacterium]
MALTPDNPWGQAEETVRELQAAVDRWRGRHVRGAVRWYYGGSSGEAAGECVRLALTVDEARALARHLPSQPPR